jgi:hypothetical protein
LEAPSVLVKERKLSQPEVFPSLVPLDPCNTSAAQM